MRKGAENLRLVAVVREKMEVLLWGGERAEDNRLGDEA